jgi:hypothetical protein
MFGAYAVFALAVAVAASFVLTIRIWINHEEKAIGH